MSGAFATTNKTTNTIFQGDIFTEDKAYDNWVIECKIRKKPITISELTSKHSQLWQWIEQTETEAGNNPSMLIFTWNRSHKILGLTQSTTLAFKLLDNKLELITNQETEQSYWFGKLKNKRN